MFGLSVVGTIFLAVAGLALVLGVIYLVSRVWHHGKNDSTIHYVDKLRERK